MLPIRKHHEPSVLADFRKHISNASNVAPYDAFVGLEGDDNNVKPLDQLSLSLLKEQHFYCAYCGIRIEGVRNPNGTRFMKVEHFVPQNKTVQNDLNYANLLACCRGNDCPKSKGANHCDSSKGNALLLHIKNPATIRKRDREIVYRVKTNSNEVIVGLSVENESKEIELTGSNYLNLNHETLKHRRFTEFVNQIQKKLGKEEGAWNPKRVEQLLEDLASSQDSPKLQFKDFILWYLDDWLRRYG